MDEQLIQSNKLSTGYMPIVDNILYQPNHDVVDESLENLI